MGIRVWKYLSDKVIPPYRPSALGKAITDSMTQFPDDWMVERHTVKHLPSEIEIWAANTNSDRKIYAAPSGIDFEAANKHLSWGDRIAINALINKLRMRSKSEGDDARIIELLKKA